MELLALSCGHGVPPGGLKLHVVQRTAPRHFDPLAAASIVVSVVLEDIAQHYRAVRAAGDHSVAAICKLHRGDGGALVVQCCQALVSNLSVVHMHQTITASGCQQIATTITPARRVLQTQDLAIVGLHHGSLAKGGDVIHPEVAFHIPGCEVAAIRARSDAAQEGICRRLSPDRTLVGWHERLIVGLPPISNLDDSHQRLVVGALLPAVPCGSPRSTTAAAQVPQPEGTV
mmetsp:Transcript_27044/g.76199  ORF Transcript_27044/g.76199 Transcript_27044/m.76199 type:complete len:230 (-) Transcript_27044:923-1612(-)